ncbi:MAG: hypothetical protein ACJ739_07995 [Acidimicrobiales bacterium]
MTPGSAPGEGPARLLVSEIVVVHDHVEMRPVALAQLLALVVEEEPEHVDQRLALAPGQGFVEVTGVGQPEPGGDDLRVLDVEGALEIAAAVDCGDEHRLRRRFLVRCLLLQHGVGLRRPRLHGSVGAQHIELREERHDLGLVLRPELGAAVGDVGDDDLDLPVAQRARLPRIAGHREVAEPPANLEDPVGVLVGPAQPRAAPRRHRRIPVALVVAGGFERDERRSEPGGEGRMALGDLGHGVGVRGDHEGVDRFPEPQRHRHSVHQFDRSRYPRNGA